MKAKDFTLKAVNEIDENEIDENKFELVEFKPYMTYASYVNCILGDAEILRPTGITDVEGRMIYENYIVEVEEMIGDKREYKCIVQYNDSKARFEAKEIRKDMKYIHVFEILNSLCVLKIIGNIYQNKGLLN